MYFGYSFLWTIIIFNILAARTLDFAPEHLKGTYLGIVSTAGAAVALITCPLIGIISDRSKFKMGRRRPYLILSVMFASLSLLCLTFAPKYSLFLISFLFLQFFANIGSIPFSALIPDKVSQEQRGEASGIMSFMDVFARIIGAGVGGYMMSNRNIPNFITSHSPEFLRETFEKYIASNTTVPTIFLIIFIMVILLIYTLIVVKEEPNENPKPIDKKIFHQAFIFDIKGNTSFAWLILSRVFYNLAIFTITCFILYYIKDYLNVKDLHKSQLKVGILMAVVSITALPSALLTGYLSDLYGRRKIFIYISSIFMIIVSFSFIMISNFNQALIIGAIFGIAFGAFVTSDWALAIDLLPKEEQSAKNLGIWNYAGVGPQVIAPAIGGIILDRFNLIKDNLGYQVVFGTVIIYLIIGTLLFIKVKEKEFKRSGKD